MSDDTAAPTWRDMAVARSLDPARARAESRVQRFLDAALELMSASGSDFTVQEVVERSGQSLRSFYQYFAGKYELLLALFEESVRAATEHLQHAVAEVDDPLERLHVFSVEYYRLCRPAPRGKSSKKVLGAAIGGFVQQLLTEHPKEASRAFVPVVSLFEELLADAEKAGKIRKGLPHAEIAGVVLQAIMFNVFAAAIAGASVNASADASAEHLWEMLINGIGA